MPTYQYACTLCGNQLEAVQSFTDESLTECPQCQGRLRKQYSAVGIVFKGSGFYRTDSRAAAKSENGAKADAAASADGGSKPEVGAKSGAGAKSEAGASSSNSNGSTTSGSGGSPGPSGSPAAKSGDSGKKPASTGASST